jgi:WD40 repeat protein
VGSLSQRLSQAQAARDIIMINQIVVGPEATMVRKRSAATSSAGILWNVPPLPKEYLERPELAAIKAALTCPPPKATDGIRERCHFAVRGMAGTGKTVLAAALSQDADVRRAFQDGIFWLTAGRSADALTIQERLLMAVSGLATLLTNSEQGKDQLRTVLADLRCLIVLDDVWSPELAQALDVVSGGSVMLLTSRSDAVAKAFCSDPCFLGELPVETATQLLARSARVSLDDLPDAAHAIVSECGRLALALAMAGSMLRDKPLDRWLSLASRLRDVAISHLRDALPQYPYRSLLASIEVSVEDLPVEIRERYAELAVFPEHVALPERTLSMYWASEGMDMATVQDCVDLLIERSLAHRDAAGFIALHDLQRDYVVVRARATFGNDLLALHQRVLVMYRRVAPNGLHEIVDDGYFFAHAAHHLCALDGGAELRGLVLDIRWLMKKLAATNLRCILADFKRLSVREDPPIRLLAEATTLAASGLAERGGELISQLVGRLLCCRDPELTRFVDSARRLAPPLSLIPARPVLTPPGGPLLRLMGPHGWPVESVAVTDDGQFGFSVQRRGQIRQWDLETGTLVRSVDHGEEKNCGILSSGGGFALFAESEGSIARWDVRAGSLLNRWESMQWGVFHLGLSRDGKIACSGSLDNLVRFWDAENGTPLHTIRIGSAASTIALSGDGRHALVGYDRTFSLWDVRTGELEQKFGRHGLGVSALTFSNDGSLVVSGSYDRVVRLWSRETGELLEEYEGHQGMVATLAFSRKRPHRVLSGSMDGSLIVWSLVGNVVSKFGSHSSFVNAIAVTPDGSAVFSGDHDGNLRLWDLSKRESTTPPLAEGHAGAVSSLSLSADGLLALSGSDDKTIGLWNVETAHQLRKFSLRLSPMAVAFGRGDSVILSGSFLNRYEMQRTATGEVVQSFGSSSGAGLWSMAFSADGAWVIAGMDDGEIQIWEVDTGSMRMRFRAHENGVRAVDFDHERKLILSGSDELRLWSTDTGRKIHDLKFGDGPVTSVALSRDGQRGASALGDGSIVIWRTSTGGSEARLDGHRSRVGCLAFSSDGELLLSGSSDCTLRLWGVARGRLEGSFTAEAPIRSAAFTPDGRRVIAGDALGHVHILDL